MMGPNREAQNASPEGRVEHGLVCEELLAGEHGDDFSRNADRRQEDDVHLGMAKEPEKMLPKDGVPALVRVEKRGAEGLIKDQHNCASKQWTNREHEQNTCNNDHPDHDRNVIEFHARRTGVHRRGDKIDAAK